MELTASSEAVEEELASIEARLAFTRPSDVSHDTTRPGGVQRAKTLPFDVDPSELLEAKLCRVTDCAAPGPFRPSLAGHGFDTIDLSDRAALLSRLERVRQAGHLANEDVAEIRRKLWGRSFRLSDRKRLRILYVAPEGVILRKAGPNGLRIDPHEKMTDRNGHGAAVAVHGDQDVRGTPVRQILRGAGPLLFRHESPDGANRRSPFFLVNVWIPLQQITRPLALMDERTLDRRRHQLRYALPTESFFDRDEDRRINDIWSYLHDERQRWYFTSEMDARRAYVFNTLGTPHGAFVLPGEELAERLYLRLKDAREAIVRRDVAALRAIAARGGHPPLSGTTLPLRRAIHTMQGLLDEAHDRSGELCAHPDDGWNDRAARAMDRVVRKSVELRAVALVTRDR